MNPRITAVKALDNYKLELSFTNKEHRIFNMEKYLNLGVFKELRDKKKFSNVCVFLGTVKWNTGQDLCPDTLYEESERNT